MTVAEGADPVGREDGRTDPVGREGWRPAAGGRVLRVATLNLQHGLGADGEAPDAERLAAAVAGLDVDVLALQEVDVGQPRSGRVDQAAIVAEATGLGHWRFAAALVGDVRRRRRPGRTTGRPGYGVALLSRHPVLAWFAQPLPAAPAGVADEPRVALAGIVRTPVGLVCVASTHLSLLPPVAVGQLVSLRRRLAGLTVPRTGPPIPALLLGDLNLRPSLVRVAGLPLLARGLTFPAGAPTRQIDHVLGLGPVRVAGPAATERLAVSDHRLLRVDVGLP